jgi:hypothetical protein
MQVMAVRFVMILAYRREFAMTGIIIGPVRLQENPPARHARAGSGPMPLPLWRQDRQPTLTGF